MKKAKNKQNVRKKEILLYQSKPEEADNSEPPPKKLKFHFERSLTYLSALINFFMFSYGN